MPFRNFHIFRASKSDNRRNTYVVRKHRWTDFEALQSGKAWSAGYGELIFFLSIQFSWHAKEYPTDPFTILEPRDQEIAEFYFVQERRATDFEARKL